MRAYGKCEREGEGGTRAKGGRWDEESSHRRRVQDASTGREYRTSHRHSVRVASRDVRVALDTAEAPQQ